MKKGCFLSVIILLTIIIGSIIYIIRKYGDRIEDYGKEKIMEITIKKMNEKFDKLKSTKYRDSLKIFLSNKAENLKKLKFEDAFNNFQVIIDQTKIYIDDGIIDSTEFSSLKKLAIENERSKKN